MNPPSFVDEYQAIFSVIETYLEGCKLADSSGMQSAFDPRGTLWSVDPDGNLSGGSIQLLFDALDQDMDPSPDANAVVVRIDIVGTAASARIDTDNLIGITFTDFFHLLKVHGSWKVVSKIFHAHG